MPISRTPAWKEGFGSLSPLLRIRYRAQAVFKRMPVLTLPETPYPYTRDAHLCEAAGLKPAGGFGSRCWPASEYRQQYARLQKAGIPAKDCRKQNSMHSCDARPHDKIHDRNRQIMPHRNTRDCMNENTFAGRGNRKFVMAEPPGQEQGKVTGTVRMIWTVQAF